MEEIDRGSISICKKGIRTTLGLSNQLTLLLREHLVSCFSRFVGLSKSGPGPMHQRHRLQSTEFFLKLIFLNWVGVSRKKTTREVTRAQNAGKRMDMSANRTHVHDEMNLQNKDLCHG